MLSLKSISFLVVSTLIVLPVGIARAGGVDVQTGNVRVTVGKNDGIIIKSRPTGVRVIPNHRASSPIYRRQPWPMGNSQSTHNTWIKKTTQCHGSSYSHQSTQTSGSGRSVAQTHSSTSTTVCR